MKYFLVYIAFCLLFCSNISLFAQIENFDLSQYILPEIKLKSFDMSAALRGSNSNNSSNLNLGTYSTFSNNLGFRYTSFVSSPKVQKQVFLNFTNDLYFKNRANVMGLASREVVNNKTEFRWSRVKRNYFQAQRFYGVGTKINLQNSLESAINNGGVQSSSSQLLLDLSIPIIYGLGRVEPVTDAWKAIRIIKDFEDLDLLTRTPTQNEIMELAQLISAIRYTRYFDSRKRTIRNMQILDAHISETGLIKDANSIYFTSLYDMYRYGVQAVRLSGERFTFGISPGVELDANYYNNKTNTLSYLYNAMLSVAYDAYTPINQEWQLDLQAKLQARYELVPNRDKNYISTNATFSIETAYYPTQRTVFNAKFDIRAGYLKPLNSIATSSNFARFNYASSLKTGFQYYLSARTRISANLNLRYRYNYNFRRVLTTFATSHNDGFSMDYFFKIKHALY